jgi:hypothetical protein
VDIRPNAEIDHVDQCRQVLGLARNPQRALSIRERGVGIAKQPPCYRSPGKACGADVLAELRRQRAMLRRIVKRNRLIEMSSRVYDVSRVQEGQTHLAMPDHDRPGHALRLRQRQKLDGKFTHHVAIEGDKIRDPQAVKNGVQQQGIFRELAELARAFNQRTRSLDGSSGFRCGVAADMQERRYQLHVKLDLIAAQRGRA